MPQKKSESQTVNHWVEFKTLKDLFSFVITKSIPGQQFISLIRYKDITYAFTPLGDNLMIFYTKEEPKSSMYSWDPEGDRYIPETTADRTRLNILIQQVEQDTLIQSLFYSEK